MPAYYNSDAGEKDNFFIKQYWSFCKIISTVKIFSTVGKIYCKCECVFLD